MIALGDEPVLPGAIPVTDLLGLRGIPSAANRPVVNAAAIRTDAPSLCEQPVRRNGAHCRVASAPSSEVSRVPLHVGEEKALPGKPTERIDVDVKRMLLRLAFVATLAAGSALSPIGVSADQPSWTLSIRQQAELLALGAVVLTVTYSCNSGVSGPSAGLTSIVQQTGIIGRQRPRAPSARRDRFRAGHSCGHCPTLRPHRALRLRDYLCGRPGRGECAVSGRDYRGGSLILGTSSAVIRRTVELRQLRHRQRKKRRSRRTKCIPCSWRSRRKLCNRLRRRARRVSRVWKRCRSGDWRPATTTPPRRTDG